MGGWGGGRWAVGGKGGERGCVSTVLEGVGFRSGALVPGDSRHAFPPWVPVHWLGDISVVRWGEVGGGSFWTQWRRCEFGSLDARLS